jgi:hypothetical protein
MRTRRINWNITFSISSDGDSKLCALYCSSLEIWRHFVLQKYLNLFFCNLFIFPRTDLYIHDSIYTFTQFMSYRSLYAYWILKSFTSNNKKSRVLVQDPCGTNQNQQKYAKCHNNRTNLWCALSRPTNVSGIK